MSATVNGAKLSATERNFRSRIAQLATGQWFLRGTLSERARACGKPRCRCTRGQLHKSLYVVQSQGGSFRQICVPQTWQERVRQTILMRKLPEEVSQPEWRQLAHCRLVFADSFGQVRLDGHGDIDLGVRTAATLSSGEKLAGPKALHAHLERLQRLSRGHSRKKKGSHNRGKSALRLAGLHARIWNVR